MPGVGKLMMTEYDDGAPSCAVDRYVGPWHAPRDGADAMRGSDLVARGESQGLVPSLRMLVSEPGWLRTVALVALIAWVPIVGQVAVLGCGLEWARLTAWGSRGGLRQRGIDVSRAAGTGVRAFIICLAMALAAGILLAAAFGWGRHGVISYLPLRLGSIAFAAASALVDLSPAGLAGILLSLLAATFIMAAMMRAALYDDFAAGWRLDRLVQMVARDPVGFLHVWLAVVAGCVVSVVYILFTVMLGGVALLSGLYLLFSDEGIAMGAPLVPGAIIEELVEGVAGIGAGPLVLLAIAAIIAIYGHSLITVMTQLVSLNAVGQWFARFDVARWGVSSAPLPAGVPYGRAGTAPDAPGTSFGTSASPGAAGCEDRTAPATSRAVADSYWDEVDG